MLCQLCHLSINTAARELLPGWIGGCYAAMATPGVDFGAATAMNKISAVKRCAPALRVKTRIRVDCYVM